MLKFKTSCAVLAYLSSHLLKEIGLSLIRYFEVGLRVCDIVVKKLTFAISSSDEFLSIHVNSGRVVSIFPGRQCNMLYTSGFLGDVMLLQP